MGIVCDTYVPDRKWWRKQERFGFVRFRKIQEAHACIRRFNGATVRGNKIQVAMARPKNRQKGPVSAERSRSTQKWQVRNGNKGGETPREADSQHVEQSCMISLLGEKNVSIEEWLTRTLVCTTMESRDLAALASAISDGVGQYIKVAALSCHKFLLTFPTLEEMELALDNQIELEQWFVEIKRWGTEEVCDSRRVWLYIMGVPPHGWLWENFKQIAELWGEFICLGRSTNSIESFEVMKVLVATKVFQFIEGEVLLHIGYGGYRVTIREAETVSQLIYHPQQGLKGNMVAKDSNHEVPGFEDLDDMEVYNSNQRQWQEQDEGMSKGECSLNSNSNSNGSGNGSPISNSNPSGTGNRGINDCAQKDDSYSRTKTVSFSQNDFSEELLKVSQKSRMATKEAINVQEDVEAQAPPGFEMRTANLLSSSTPKDNLDRVQRKEKGSDINSQNSHVEPPGFEKVKAKHVNQLKTKPIHKQTRTGRKLSDSISSSSTNGTTESMLKIAHEALQVGELLGVRVIGNKKEAVARITDHLKQRKIQKRKASPTN